MGRNVTAPTQLWPCRASVVGVVIGFEIPALLLLLPPTAAATDVLLPPTAAATDVLLLHASAEELVPVVEIPDLSLERLQLSVAVPVANNLNILAFEGYKTLIDIILACP